MPFTIIQGDLTKMETDAIVNAANTQLLMGGGVCGAIFKGAGPETLQAACDPLAPIETSQAVITPGFNLKAKYIIHAAGPIYHNYDPNTSRTLLYNTYKNSLLLAQELNLESIAFPLISSGIYGYPKEEALQVANLAIKDFLADHDMDVYLTIFDKKNLIINLDLLREVDLFIDENYLDYDFQIEEAIEYSQEARARDQEVRDRYEVSYAPASAARPTRKSAAKLEKKLDHMLNNLDQSFSQYLFALIDAKGKSDVDVYKKANLDRKLFSKIRSKKDYRPSKTTAIALALALELNLEETDDLLKRAGYALSQSQIFDVIISYFIIQEIYDVFLINQVLFKYDQALLGS